jgi:hypothetical protein
VQEDGHEAELPLHTYGAQLGLPVEPDDMLVQVPKEPVRLQASHAPAQAVLQQRPSTQWPLVHWKASVHTAPSALLATQAPPWQCVEPSQSLCTVQDVGQLTATPEHRYGAQLGEPVAPAARGTQLPTEPLRSQASQPPEHGASQQTPPTQWLLRHCQAS